MARVLKVVSASTVTLLISVFVAGPGCSATTQSARADLETPTPPPSPPEEQGPSNPATSGPGPRSTTGTGSVSGAEGPSGPGGGASPSGGSVMGGPTSSNSDTGASPSGRLSCIEHPSCNVDKPCVGGLHCVRIEGCESPLCMTPQAACMASCGKPDCSILESYPAQLSCTGGPGEPPAPEPDVIAGTTAR